MIVGVGFEEDDAAVGRHGIEQHRQPGANFMWERSTDFRPDDALRFRALGRVGDQNGVIRHDTRVSIRPLHVTARRSTIVGSMSLRARLARPEIDTSAHVETHGRVWESASPMLPKRMSYAELFL